MYVYMNICKENFFANKLLMMMMMIHWDLSLNQRMSKLGQCGTVGISTSTVYNVEKSH
jgi:hypothetical protein